MTNKAYERCVKIPITVPVGVVSGGPVLVGDMPGVAATTRDATSGLATIDFEGAFFLEVHGGDLDSPPNDVALKPGDPIYAIDVTTDTATNVSIVNELGTDDTAPLFGFVLDAVTSGEDQTVRVRVWGTD